MLTKQEIDDFELDPIVTFIYDYVIPISPDRVLATHGGQISLITKSGEMICTYDSIQIPTYDVDPTEGENNTFDLDTGCICSDIETIDDMLLILDNGKWGLIDYDGDVLLEAQYTVLRFIGKDQIESLI